MSKNDKKDMNFQRMIVWAAEPEKKKEAADLSAHLSLPFLEDEDEVREDDLVLRLDHDGLALQGGGLSLQGDFTHMNKRLTKANLPREFLVKAAKIKQGTRQPVAVDATAGLGEDAILLAAAGFEVYLFEYNPVIAALLKDALRRASELENLAPIVSRMHFKEGNSIGEMKKLPFTPDVVLLDPMFPARQKSALVKRKFQLLHALEMPCGNEEELLYAAIDAGPKKVIIKRPVKGPYLAGIKADYSYQGKAVRYDCLLVHEKKEAKKEMP